MSNPKSIKKIIIFLIVLLIVCITSIVILNKKYIMQKDKIDIDEDKYNVEKGIVKNSSLYFTSEKYLNTYFTALSENNEEETYKLLDNYYIQTNNITEDNVLEKCKTNIEKNIVFTAESMEYSLKNKIYILNVKGYITEESYDDFYENYYEDEYEKNMIEQNERTHNENIDIIIKLDYNNMTFSIIPNYIEDIEKIRNEIEKNQYNQFSDELVGDIDVVNRYYSKYTENSYNDIEKAYNMLDKEYREKRFKDINEYKEYIDQKGTYSEINRYAVNTTNNYKQYICLDEEENYYIFIETATMQYTVILDTYTIDIPEFIEKYNNGTEQQKVALNIQKFIQAIDSKDYNYAYNCLSDGFKKNYFDNIDEFKKYVEENFYSRNIVTYTKFEEESGIYKYTVNIDNANYAEEIRTKTFIVKLNEGTGFELSFNV